MIRTTGPAASRLIRRFSSIAGAGFGVALLLGAGGRAVERSRLGADDRTAMARLEGDVRQTFSEGELALAALTGKVSASGELVREAVSDSAAAADLFVRLDELLEGTDGVGLTVFDANLRPLAWSGRVSDVPASLLSGSSLKVLARPSGPRLVRTAILGEPARIAVIAAEQILGRSDAPDPSTESFLLPTRLGPVDLRPATDESGPGPPNTFVIRSGEGAPLAEARIMPSVLADARSELRQRAGEVTRLAIGITCLLCLAPLIDERRRRPTRKMFIVLTLGMLTLLAASRVVLGLATGQLAPAVAGPSNLMLNALLSSAVAWLVVDIVECRRTSSPRAPVRARLGGVADPLRLMAAYGAAGAGASWLLWTYAAFLHSLVGESPIELIRFSLHPLELGRLTAASALVVLHAAVVWTAATFVRVAGLLGRPPRRWPGPPLIAVAWLLGAVVGMQVLVDREPALPVFPISVGLATAGLCAMARARLRTPFRRASQAARLGLLYVALLVPSVALYPSLDSFATEARERLIATEYGPQAANLREALQDSLRRALEAIDAIPGLGSYLQAPDSETPTTREAFQIWSRTDLAASRLTSAVELYDRHGELVSRFARNLPDFSVPSTEAVGCTWEILDEASFFGSSERHVLRASRGICDDGPRRGTIVVRAMLDYHTLPFIASRSPYLESLQPRGATGAALHDQELEFVAYGWSRAPFEVSGTSVFPLSESVFQRMVVSRDAFWATVTRDDGTFRVYFMSDRGGIYALGYPLTTSVGHLINLAELGVLAGVLYALMLTGAGAFNIAGTGAASSGRALLREFRSSFYRKLSLAFVGVSVVPVVALALATRAYFASELQASLEDSAVQTATVAQRLVEDYATLQQRSRGTLDLIDDQIMVLVSRAIGQSVNLFDGSELQATSERDLFAAQVLPTRTPANAYRAIALERLPTYVGEEEVGGLRYLVAAAPVRPEGALGVVTVPQTLRRPDTERQRDELDRRVLSASVLFVLIGLGLGYSMAERIADPVNRLTRATRRIARGDLDARIAATSSDELRRLVEDFNRMAADLKRQRSELERTKRLEAWAEVARQVAHDIKNPLTPIQLSAEHARRINQDRGRPLSPALDDCINAILGQVRLLREISTEFSSFASSPTPRPELVELPALIEEVIQPYRSGLSGRVVLDVRAESGLPAVHVDRLLFARALTNVVENALHAMPGGGTLSVMTRRQSGSLVVRIADTGIGMDRDALAKVFEPYFSTKATGTGLGLTIAKRNIELNGGTIAVESTRGVGSSVTFTLPVPA